MMSADLHVHSTWSDGSVPAPMLPVIAKGTGLRAIAISDHDSMAGIAYSLQNPILEGVSLVPATELSAYDFDSCQRVHILCYYPDADCAVLEEHCKNMADSRLKCTLQSCKELEGLFPQFKTDMALQYAQDSGVLFKSGIMQALCQLGLADRIYGDLYHELFGFGPGEGKVLHNPPYISVQQALEIVHAARGVCVFAHPSVYHSMPLVRRLVREKMIDGIEIFHPRNTEIDKEECLRLARENDLIITGGTDFHGANSKHPKPLGTCRTEESQWFRIRELAQKRKR